MVVIQKEEVLAIIKQRGKAREQLLSILLEIQKLRAIIMLVVERLN